MKNFGQTSSLASGRRLRRNRGGYAMGLFLVVLMVMTTTVVMLLNATATQSKSAAQLTELTKAKFVATAALDHFYARLQTTDNFLQNGDQSDVKSASAPVSAAPWHKIVNGKKQSCASIGGQPDLYAACYYLMVKQVNVDPTISTLPTALEVSVSVRYDCRGDESLCRTLTMEQRLRVWQFSDFLFYTQFNVVSPSLGTPALFTNRLAVRNGVDPCAVPALDRRATYDECPAVAYTDYDSVTGPVYTADDYVMVCGTPSSIFSNGSGSQTRVFARAPDGQVVKSASIRGDGCTPASVGAFGTALSSVLRLPPGRVTFDQAAAKARTMGSELSGSNVSLVFTAAGVNVSGAGSTSFIPTGSSGTVITVDGDVDVSGVVNGRVTLFSSGNVRIVDDLVYNDGIVTATSDDVLGINASGDIVISKLAPRSPCVAGGEPVRNVQAQLVSFGGTVRTESLESAQFVGPTGCPAILAIYGAMATKYQGVFGLYDSATGRVVKGYAKNFTHDTRSQSNSALTPPYLVTPVGQQWFRLDVSEVTR